MPPSNEVKMMESHFDNVSGALKQKPEVQDRQYVAFFITRESVIFQLKRHYQETQLSSTFMETSK